MTSVGLIADITQDDFLVQFEAAESLQQVFGQKLARTASAQPSERDQEASTLWRSRLRGELADYLQWSEAFVDLIDTAPAEVRDHNTRVSDARCVVLQTLARLHFILEAVCLPEESRRAWKGIS